MNFQEIEFRSAAYRLECELRNDVLRLPLGLSLFDEDLSQESEQKHFGLFDGEKLLACVIAVVLTSSAVKIRQMAVAEGHQGMGCGRKILDCLEDDLILNGFSQCSLHARSTAVGFYEKLGYACCGEVFMELGIPHIKMEKIFAHLPPQ